MRILIMILLSFNAWGWQDEHAYFEADILKTPEVQEKVNQGYDCYLQALPKELQGVKGLVVIYPDGQYDKMYAVFCKKLSSFKYSEGEK